LPADLENCAELAEELLRAPWAALERREDLIEPGDVGPSNREKSWGGSVLKVLEASRSYNDAFALCLDQVERAEDARDVAPGDLDACDLVERLDYPAC
jgi:hypothetical protein